MITHLYHRIRFAILKQKIKKNPYVGQEEVDGIYLYKGGKYGIRYRVIKSTTGRESIEWISKRLRLSRYEEKILHIKRELGKFFLYQRWVILFRPSVLIILIMSFTIFYFGIKEQSLKRIERFRWIVAQISGVSPESINYKGGGWFQIFGQRKLLDKKADPVIISFSPLWLFLSDTVQVIRWNQELNKYNTYSITINDRNDVWLEKKSGKFHGKVLGSQVAWDEPPDTAHKLSGIDVTVKDKKLKFIDE